MTPYASIGKIRNVFTVLDLPKIITRVLHQELVGETQHKTVCKISVIDNGPGIPQEHHRNVFKPFFRLDRSRSLNKSGVGLGLAIVEDIVNSHGGNIQLSKGSLNGLQVKISLPF